MGKKLVKKQPNKMIEEANKHKQSTSRYLALDTCALIYLAQIYEKQKNPNSGIKVPNEKYIDKFEEIFFQAKNGNLRFFVTDTAFEECSWMDIKKFYKSGCEINDNFITNFLRDFCYFPSDSKDPVKMKKINDLFFRYIQGGAMDPVNRNDIFIMAEATVEGLNILTHNGKDFIFVQNNKNPDNTFRRKKIRSINVVNRDEFRSLFTYEVPAPMSIDEFIKDDNFDIEKALPSGDLNKIRFDEYVDCYNDKDK